MAEHEYDLVIVGAGSGNMLLGEELSHWRVAVVEAERFGGTCLNRGCIPSKMLVVTADVAQAVRHAGRYGIGASFTGADWPAIRERVFGRIDPLHAAGVAYRRARGVDVYLGEGRFIGPKVLAVGDDVLRSERFVLALGSRPYLPPIAGLDQVPYHTSDDVMRLDRLPGSMVVIGGGYVASEMSHVFGSLGTAVTIVERKHELLAAQDADVRASFTAAYAERFDLRLGSVPTVVSPVPGGVRVELATPEGVGSVEAEVLLVATGRVPASDRIGAGEAGLQTDEHGHLVVDGACRTTAKGIWALGDIANHTQLKHLANAEARLVRHNLLHPDDQDSLPFQLVPAAVFADPQVASVGATEERLRREGREILVATGHYRDAAYGWALEDKTGFVKVIADPATRLLLGAHAIGPQASTLIQPLVQAMFLGNTVDEVGKQVLYIHPALSEVVEQALLGLC